MLSDWAVLWTTRLVYLIVAPFVIVYHLLAVLDSFILRVLRAVYAAYGGSDERVPEQLNRIVNDGIIGVALSVMLVAMITAMVMCSARSIHGMPLAPGCAS